MRYVLYHAAKNERLGSDQQLHKQALQAIAQLKPHTDMNIVAKKISTGSFQGQRNQKKKNLTWNDALKMSKDKHWWEAANKVKQDKYLKFTNLSYS